MKKDEGYVLLKSLLTIAVILVCAAAFYVTLAAAVRQSGNLEKRLVDELSYRREKIMERVK